MSTKMLLVAAGLIACGGSDPKKVGGPSGTGMSTTVMVTAEMGGMVTLEGTTLTVPPGAVPDDTEITIQSTMDAPPAAFTSWASPVYKFEPDGLVFQIPVQVTMAFTGSPANPAVQWSTTNGGFENRGGTVSGNDITTTVLHFSRGFVAEPIGPLDPDAGTVRPDSVVVPGGDGGPGPGDGGTSPDGNVSPDGGAPLPDGGTTPDGGMTPDGGTPPDGGMTPDGGMPVDGGPLPDGPIAPPDGGTSPDGGTPPDAGIMPDGGPNADGGAPPPPPPPSDGGMADGSIAPTPP